MLFFMLGIWKGKPTGGGHGLENRSELMTRVGSTPTPSAIWRVGKYWFVTLTC